MSSWLSRIKAAAFGSCSFSDHLKCGVVADHEAGSIASINPSRNLECHQPRSEPQFGKAVPDDVHVDYIKGPTHGTNKNLGNSVLFDGKFSDFADLSIDANKGLSLNCSHSTNIASDGPGNGCYDSQIIRDVIKTAIFSEFLNYFKKIAAESGTMIGRDTRCMTPVMQKKVFPDSNDTDPVIYKGYFYCIVNSKQGIHCVKCDGTKGNPRSACEWTIPFRFDTEKMLYVVSTRSKLLVLNTNHSHALNLESIRASTRRLINFEKEMSDEEVAFIKELGPSMLGVTKVRDFLRLKYRMCDYDGKLLSRLLQRGFVDHFGSDRDATSRFMDKGDEIRQLGGVFKFQIGEDGRITDVFVQKASMKAYSEKFGDFIINDGTHNVDMYGLVSMFNTLVDSLGRSIMSSYSQFRSEQSEHILRAFEHFGLGIQGSSLMTDQGSAYRIVADTLPIRHVLCTKHYHDLIFPSCAGLGLLDDEFKKAMFASIYEDFKSAETLREHFNRCKLKFGHSGAAMKFMAKLETDQNLGCLTHTISIFTAGCKSTQRGEGTNSRLKGGGKKKQEMRRYNLFHLLE